MSKKSTTKEPVRNKEKNKVKVIKTLRALLKETREAHMFTIQEIAEETNMFPSEAEQAIRELHKEKQLKCIWYKGEIYVNIKKADNAQVFQALAEKEEKIKAEENMHYA